MSAAVITSTGEGAVAAEKKSIGELVETRRFLGREFLAWLWFESELFEQRFAIEGFGDCEVWLEKQLTLESSGDREKEQSKLTGGAPSGTPEAREAMRRGKLPTQAKVVIQREDQMFVFVLGADALSLSAVKIPALVKGEGESPFYERIGLIEELEVAVETLFRDFLLLRLSAAWSRDAIPALRAWMRDEEDDALLAYQEQRKRRAGALRAEHVVEERPRRVSRRTARAVKKSR
jgi:hypothetical protein